VLDINTIKKWCTSPQSLPNALLFTPQFQCFMLPFKMAAPFRHPRPQSIKIALWLSPSLVGYCGTAAAAMLMLLLRRCCHIATHIAAILQTGTGENIRRDSFYCSNYCRPFT